MNLHHDVGAVPISLNHASETSNLAFDSTEAFQISRFDTGINSDRLARGSGENFAGAGRTLILAGLPRRHFSIPLGGIVLDVGVYVKSAASR